MHSSPPPPSSPTLLDRRRRVRKQVQYLLSPLSPFISVTTCTAHPSFPQNLLQYHLLTSPQLIQLARHYHQSSPKLESWAYPFPVAARWGVSGGGSTIDTAAGTSRIIDTTTTTANSTITITGAPSPRFSEASTSTLCEKIIDLEPHLCQRRGSNGKASLDDRRRRFGRFIGLRGCESPGMTTEEAYRENVRALELWMLEDYRRKTEREEGIIMGRFKGFI